MTAGLLPADCGWLSTAVRTVRSSLVTGRNASGKSASEMSMLYLPVAVALGVDDAVTGDVAEVPIRWDDRAGRARR